MGWACSAGARQAMTLLSPPFGTGDTRRCAARKGRRNVPAENSLSVKVTVDEAPFQQKSRASRRDGPGFRRGPLRSARILRRSRNLKIGNYRGSIFDVTESFLRPHPESPLKFWLIHIIGNYRRDFVRPWSSQCTLDCNGYVLGFKKRVEAFAAQLASPTALFNPAKRRVAWWWGGRR